MITYLRQAFPLSGLSWVEGAEREKEGRTKPETEKQRALPLLRLRVQERETIEIYYRGYQHVEPENITR